MILDLIFLESFCNVNASKKIEDARINVAPKKLFTELVVTVKERKEKKLTKPVIKFVIIFLPRSIKNYAREWKRKRARLSEFLMKLLGEKRWI